MKKIYIALIATVMGVASATANGAHTVFLKNDSGNWATAYAHVWGGNSGSNTNANGYATMRFGDTQFFVYSSENTFDNVIFTPGTDWTNQTKDIEDVNDLGGYWAKESKGDNGYMGDLFYPCFYGSWTGTDAKEEAKLTYVSGTTYRTSDFVLSNGTDVSFSFRIVDNNNTVAELSTSVDLTADGATSSTVKYNNNGKSVKLPKGSTYYLTIDFSTLEVGLVASTVESNFTINGTIAPQICGAYVGTTPNWSGIVSFTKVSDTEYTYSFEAAQETAYFGLYDSTGARFVPDNLALTDGGASTTSFTASDKDFVGGDSSNECKISGLSVNTEYVMTLKKDGNTVTLSIKAGESGDDPTPGTETVVTPEMIAGMIPTLPGAMYQVSEFEKTNNSDGKEKVLNAKGYDGINAVTPANYYWVKYEDESVYYKDGVLDANKYAASDNPKRDDITEDDDSSWKIEDSTDKTYHDCRNFSDAYYRVYMQNTEVPAGYQVWEGRPSAAVPTVLSEGFKMAAAERTSIVNPHYGKDKINVAQRVARTIFVESNTTGIEDVIAPETSDDADAPVVFYNLQGMRVENPSNGIYIRVQGKTTTKVYIK